MASARLRSESVLQAPPADGTPSRPVRSTRTRPKPLDAETRRRLVQELDAKFLPPPTVSEKLLVQAEMAYMRRVLSQDKRKVLVTYPIKPPYSFVSIRFNPQAGEFQYLVQEPTLHEEEPELIDAIRQRMEAMIDQEELPVTQLGRFGDAPELQEFLKKRFDYVLDLYDIDVAPRRKKVVFYYLQRDLVGLGRSDAVLRDPFVEDVSCNGPNLPVYVFHRVFGSVRTNVAYGGDTELNRYIMKLAQISGKHVSIYQPILDASLSDGSRVNLTLGTEVTRKGSTFSIRKFTQDPISPVDLIRLNSASAHAFAYFWELIANKRSLLISGGTASGKTTLLNALAMFIRPEDKIVSIEDTPEVHIAHANWIQSVSRAGYGKGGGKDGGQAGVVSLFDLLVAALRQRPEYILVGEVRGREAFSLFQAIQTGHAAMATIHAANIQELLHRIENEPMNIPRVLFEALDAVAFPGQVILRGNRARRIRGVTEILEVDNATQNLLTNDPFRWRPDKDDCAFLGRSFVLERIAKATGHDLDDVLAEVDRKERYLATLAEHGVTQFSEVTRAISDYYVNPEDAVRSWEQKRAG